MIQLRLEKPVQVPPEDASVNPITSKHYMITSNAVKAKLTELYF